MLLWVISSLPSMIRVVMTMFICTRPVPPSWGCNGEDGFLFTLPFLLAGKRAPSYTRRLVWQLLTICVHLEFRVRSISIIDTWASLDCLFNLFPALSRLSSWLSWQLILRASRQYPWDISSRLVRVPCCQVLPLLSSAMFATGLGRLSFCHLTNVPSFLL